jgi:hypothetical protein
MTECTSNSWGFQRDHKFEARYDLGPPTQTLRRAPYPQDFVDVMEASKVKTYVRDICVHCGATVERAK